MPVSSMVTAHESAVHESSIHESEVHDSVGKHKEE